MVESNSSIVKIERPKKFYSPLRYPGGKAGLYMFISSLIEKNNLNNCTYFEPYSGGAGAALSLLFLEKVDQIVINDFDIAIYSIWYAILNDTDKFIKLIDNSILSIEEWERQRCIYKQGKEYSLELAFASFYLNRTNRSGIIYAGGPIGGMKQSGKWRLDARFNKTNLIERIERIALYKDRITLHNRDGIDLMSDLASIESLFVYADPPYYVKGGGLYLNSYNPDDHKRLSKFLNEKNDIYWMLTYDNVQEIRDLYNMRRCYGFDLNYHANTAKIGKEVLVISDKIDFNSFEVI